MSVATTDGRQQLTASNSFSSVSGLFGLLLARACALDSPDISLSASAHLLQDLLETGIENRLVQLILVERQAIISLITCRRSPTHPSISFFILRSDLNGSKLRQKEISLHCLSSVASLNR